MKLNAANVIHHKCSGIWGCLEIDAKLALRCRSCRETVTDKDDIDQIVIRSKWKVAEEEDQVVVDGIAPFNVTL